MIADSAGLPAPTTPPGAGSPAQAAAKPAVVYAFQSKTLNGPMPRQSPAMVNASLSPAQCRKRLAALKAPFRRHPAVAGIATAVRIDGDINGVHFRIPGHKSRFGLLDCRLALTLIEVATFLREHGVVEVSIDNAYRPNAHLPGKRSKKSQHAYGLAIDVTAFKHEDGRTFEVEQDWGAGIETEPCGPLATLVTPTENTEFLRNLVCELANQRLFHHHLTPSYNAAHRNHLHFDIARDANSLWVR